MSGEIAAELRAIDPEDESIDRDSWVTPAWIAQAVGSWDLDPCTNERSHIRAKQSFILEEGNDGLALAKFVNRRTRVWCNPPYSRGQVIRWVRAYRHTSFCFLLRLDFSTDWMVELVPYVGLLLVPRDRRMNFEPPPGVASSSNPYPHGLLYRRAEDATPEIRKICYPWRPAP